MPAGQLYINGQDAFETWGISLSDSALSALMTPPPMKDRIVNESRLEHGQRMLNELPKKAHREVTLEMHLKAKTQSQFFTRYNDFCENVLATGEVNISTSFQPNVVYKMFYSSCTQFSEFMLGIAKFSLKLVEPNTNDRSDATA